MGNTVLYCHSNLSLIMIRVNYIAVAQIGFVGVWGIKFVVQYLLYRGNKNKLTNFQKLLFLLLTDFFDYPHSRKQCHWDQQLELTTSQMYICSNTIGCILIFLNQRKSFAEHTGEVTVLHSTVCSGGLQVIAGAGERLWILRPSWFLFPATIFISLSSTKFHWKSSKFSK